MHSATRFAEVYNDADLYPRLQDVASKLGVHERTVRKRALTHREKGYAPELISRQREALKGRLGYEPVLPGFRISRTGVEKDAEGATVRSWIEQKPEHGEVFDLPAGQRIKGISAFVNAQDEVIAKWIKTKDDDITADLIKALEKTFQGYTGLVKPVRAPKLVDKDLLTVYPLADLHYGMKAWAREVGQDYDRAIADARTRDMAQRLIAGSRPSKTAVLLGLGDLFHNNDSKNMTPRSGHILDVDGRWPQILEGGVHLVMDLVELALQKHEKVIVRMLPGNHDPEGAVALTVALRVAYHKNRRVVVDNDPGHHWSMEFGKVLLGATHGHTMKPERMAMMLATDCVEEWGRTIFKHFFFGHIHHESVKEIGPVRVESFNTIAGKDGHAHAGGYRSGQALVGITFHKERGEIGRHREPLLV